MRYFQWLGVLAVITGLVIVGVSDFISGDTEGEYTLNGIITGKLGNIIHINLILIVNAYIYMLNRTESQTLLGIYISVHPFS